MFIIGVDAIIIDKLLNLVVEETYNMIIFKLGGLLSRTGIKQTFGTAVKIIFFSNI